MTYLRIQDSKTAFKLVSVELLFVLYDNPPCFTCATRINLNTPSISISAFGISGRQESGYDNYKSYFPPITSSPSQSSETPVTMSLAVLSKHITTSFSLCFKYLQNFNHYQGHVIKLHTVTGKSIDVFDYVFLNFSCRYGSRINS